MIEHVRRSTDKSPKVKRRFNLLREEPPPPVMRQGLSVLAFLVLVACVALVGTWKTRSGRDPSLPKPQLLSLLVDIDEAGASPAGPFSGIFPTRDDAHMEPGSPAPERQVRAEEEDAAVPAHSTTEGERPPRKVREPFPVHENEQVYFRKAQSYHKHKNFEMAAKMYRRVLHEKPGHRDALYYLSSLYMEQSAYAEAYPLIMELLRLNPGDPQGLANLGVSEIALGRPEQAIAHLDEALTFEDPPEFKIYFHQGVARSKLQRMEEAITWYRKAEGLDPGHRHLLFNMAVTLDSLGRYKEALDFYARFLKAGEFSSPKERRDVERRIGVLLAYLAEAPRAPSAEGTHRYTE